MDDTNLNAKGTSLLGGPRVCYPENVWNGEAPTPGDISTKKSILEKFTMSRNSGILKTFFNFAFLQPYHSWKLKNCHYWLNLTYILQYIVQHGDDLGAVHVQTKFHDQCKYVFQSPLITILSKWWKMKEKGFVS